MVEQRDGGSWLPGDGRLGRRVSTTVSPRRYSQHSAVACAVSRVRAKLHPKAGCSSLPKARQPS